jgi:hypothetical protein
MTKPFTRDDNPFEAVAFQEFLREFGDLISVRAKVEDYEFSLVSTVLGNLFFRRLDASERNRWHRTVRAAHHYLDMGALKRTRESCESYVRIANHIPQALNHVGEQHSAAEEAAGDLRVERFLSVYKTTVEELLTLIAAPVVVGFRHVYGVQHTAFNPKPDGRVNLGAIDKMEEWSATPSNLLKVGLNRHVRNAYAHNRFRVLDGERIEMWDEDGRGNRTWGPEVWRFAEVESLCEQLHTTCLAIVLALAVFGINYRALIVSRGWIPKNLSAPNMREGEIRRVVELYAEYNSLVVKSFDKASSGELRMELRTQSRGVDQTEKFLLGGPRGARAYGKPVRYERRVVAEAVLALLQRAVECSDEITSLRAAVTDEDGHALGELVYVRAALANVRGPEGADLDADRRLATTDTLGDAQMWSRIEGPVRPL